MRVSLEWLAEYVDLPAAGPERVELLRRMEMAGLAIDSITEQGQEVAGIVAGKVLSIAAHPNAERLLVVDIDLGTCGAVQCVSGADNFRVGDVVPVVVPGGVLPGGRPIDAAEIRGVRSHGMMCSPAELGLGDDAAAAAGIMILDPATEPGTDCVELLGLRDVVIELDLTPNYAVFCQSMVGVAIEVAALSGEMLRLPGGRATWRTGYEPTEAGLLGPHSAAELRSVATGPAGQLASVRIDAPSLCPRYSGALFEDLRIGPSPAWMQRRLRAAGVRPINNIVDVTNYVMLELGQPLHAFDFDLVQGGSIVVREALPDEKITTLDGVERVCPPGSLVIADAGRGIALAGVMGGANSEITGTTRRMFLESANFLRTSVRRTSRRLGLRSEASGRFEKGVDPAGTVRAIERAAELLAETGAARRVEGIIDVVAETHGPQLITAPVSYLRDLIGIPLDGKEMADLLGQIGITAWLADDQDGSDCSASSIIAEVPTRRLDVEGKADLAEEIARAYGYDRIKPELPTLAMPAASLPPRRLAVQRVRRALLGCGLDELVTFAYHSADEFDRLRLAADHPWRLAMPVLNPMSDEQALMRTSLVPNLLRVAALNAGHGVDGLRAFEVGRAYLPKALPLTELPDEPLRLAVLLTGPTPGPDGWRSLRRDADFFDLKGTVTTALDRFGLAVAASYRAVEMPFMHPGRTAEVWLDDTAIGWLGEVHPDVAAGYDLRRRVCVAELDFNAIFARAAAEPQYGGLPRFPGAERDLAVVVPLELSAVTVMDAIRGAGGTLLEDLSLFDVYEGAQVDQGARSLAFRLLFRASDRTLTDAEVDAAMAEIVAAVAGTGGRVRG